MAITCAPATVVALALHQLTADLAGRETVLRSYVATLSWTACQLGHRLRSCCLHDLEVALQGQLQLSVLGNEIKDLAKLRRTAVGEMLVRYSQHAD